ncbi:GNAT family N-acetyltransferase [Arenibaculum pallidiluteum]|uniref:GNAT family N-acetyltransferase n=1 Tax=Arenibaculum pallidiluteum TaxID=2812559 RepID=UPI001A96653E|nr:GNAT family N-acetyltransferase [Arenibaculum pallidiluteum]
MMETEVLHVRHRPDGRIELAEIRQLSPGEAEDVARLQDEGLGDLMFPVTPGQIADMLGPGGRTVGAFVGGRLAGFMAATVPGRGEANLGLHLGLGQAELNAVAHWTAVIVHPDYRGNGLHRRLAMAAQRALDLPRTRFWLATARCENLPSARNFLSVGAEIAAILAKYDGNLRYLFMLDRLAPPVAYEQVEEVPAGALDLQRELVGAGFRGFASSPGGIRFGLPVRAHGAANAALADAADAL